MDADTVRKGHAKQSVRVSVPQVGFAEEGELVKIVDGLDIVQGYALFFHFLTVVGHVVPHMCHLLEEALILQSTQIFIGHGFNFRLEILFHLNHLLIEKT